MKKYILIILMVIFSFSVGALPIYATNDNPSDSTTDNIYSIPSKEGYALISAMPFFPDITVEQKYDWVNAYPSLFPKLKADEEEEYKALYPSEYYNNIYVTGIDKQEVDTKSVIKIISDLMSSSNMMWLMIPNAIMTGQSPLYDGYFDIMSVANIPSIQIIFKTFAYSICLLFIGINLLSTTLKYEIFTLRGGAKVIGNILLAKIWVDLSYTICRLILEINNSIVENIVIDSMKMTFFNGNFLPESQESSIPVIGPIIDYFNAIGNSIPIGIMSFVVTISAGIIIIKLMLRSIELAAMVAISPPFFACISGGDSTIRYFRNFITAFISLTIETIYIAIVYYVGSMWFKDVAADSDNVFLMLLPNCLVIIGIMILVVKPPRMFKNLIN